MHQVVLLPGIMGSRLSLGAEEVWPPTPREVVFGYRRLAKLTDPAVEATGVIRSVSCYTVYASLIERLEAWGYPEFPAVGSSGQLQVWAYDWRLDNRETGRHLARFLRGLAITNPPGVVTLLAHSMGGLIARYALEADDPLLGDCSWRERVDKLITMGTPHLGAPLALVRATGGDGALGLSAADVRTMMADARYPSGYQLLPSPSACACWNQFSGGQVLEPVNVNDPSVAGPLGLDTSNLAAARELQESLAAGHRPTTCRYFSFVGRQEQTIVRTELTSPVSLVAVRDADAGDGTVPVWSGTLAAEQFQLDGDEHGTTFKNRRLLETLGRLLGVPAMRAAAAAEAAPQPRCVLPSPILEPDAPTIVRVELATPVAGELTVRVYVLDEAGAIAGAPLSTVSVSIEGLADSKPSVAIRAPTRPGTYACVADLISSTGSQLRSEPEPFVVQSP